MVVAVIGFCCGTDR